MSKYPELFSTLLASGMWTTEDLKKLAGLNFLRVFREVERVNTSKIEILTLLNYNNIKSTVLLVANFASMARRRNICGQNASSAGAVQGDLIRG